jgi:hypothetical protein
VACRGHSRNDSSLSLTSITSLPSPTSLFSQLNPSLPHEPSIASADTISIVVGPDITRSTSYRGNNDPAIQCIFSTCTANSSFAGTARGDTTKYLLLNWFTIIYKGRRDFNWVLPTLHELLSKAAIPCDRTHHFGANVPNRQTKPLFDHQQPQ